MKIIPAINCNDNTWWYVVRPYVLYFQTQLYILLELLSG